MKVIFMEDSALNISFRKAKESDLNDVFQVVTDAIAEMNRNNIFQWDEFYPDRELLKEDISKNQLFLGRADGEIASIYVLNSECEEEYEDGEWQYPDASFGVIHRLCVNPKLQNKGVGRMTVEHIEEALKAEGIEAIRIDAFTLNPFALKMYDKLGFSKVGTVDWRKGRFWLMEKKL